METAEPSSATVTVVNALVGEGRAMATVTCRMFWRSSA
jgi:hypothetical protein